MGGGWPDGKRTQWLGFLLLRKIERTAEFFEGEGESKRKRLCVCSSGGRNLARGPMEAETLWHTITNYVPPFFVIAILSFHCILAG